jgi:hypothetical protein
VVTDEKDGTTVWNEDGAGGSETELLPPATQAGPTAWSDYQEDKPVREGLSWKQVSLIAAAIFIPLTAVAVMIISSWIQQHSKPPVVSEPLKVGTVPPAAAPQAPVVVPPPVSELRRADLVVGIGLLIYGYPDMHLAVEDLKTLINSGPPFGVVPLRVDAAF